MMRSKTTSEEDFSTFHKEFQILQQGIATEGKNPLNNTKATKWHIKPKFLSFVHVLQILYVKTLRCEVESIHICFLELSSAISAP